jgi:DinB family protein
MSDQALRQHLKRLLLEEHAHASLAAAVREFPIEKAGIRPGGAPHSAWELLEHIRIAQEDITRFSQSSEGYVVLRFPDDYWPASPAPAGPKEWNRSVAAIEEDLARFLKLLDDPQRDLFQPFPWGEGQTLLREALLIADHNAYHVGQLMLVRRMLGA